MEIIRTINQGLEVVNGEMSFASSIPAYHGQGQIFNRAMTIEEALTASHANYEVKMQPVVALTPELMDMINNYDMVDSTLLRSQLLKSKKWHSTMRLDNGQPLGIVSERYGIVQNSDAFKFIDLLTTGKVGDANNTPVIETAGVLGQGERIFVTAKFPESIRLDNHEHNNIDMYVVFTTSHDGSGAVLCLISPVRVVCQNTLNWAIKGAVNKLSFKHTINVNSRMDLLNAENAKFAYDTLGMLSVYQNSLEEELKHMHNIMLTQNQINDVLAEVCFADKKENIKVYRETHNPEHADISTRAKNIFSAMNDTLFSGIGQQELIAGSAEWLLNGVSCYYQNVANFKDEERKADAILEGSASKKMQLVHDLVTRIVA